MYNKICCFAGHGNIYNETIKDSLRKAIIMLIEKENVHTFWVGNYGRFDGYVSSVLRELKKVYPKIKVELVIPYLTKEIELYLEYYRKVYDNILLSDIPESTPPRFRIIKSNEFMVNKCDYLICYVVRTYGGAYRTLKYANSKSKTIINIAEI